MLRLRRRTQSTNSVPELIDNPFLACGERSFGPGSGCVLGQRQHRFPLSILRCIERPFSLTLFHPSASTPSRPRISCLLIHYSSSEQQQQLTTAVTKAKRKSLSWDPFFLPLSCFGSWIDLSHVIIARPGIAGRRCALGQTDIRPLLTPSY